MSSSLLHVILAIMTSLESLSRAGGSSSKMCHSAKMADELILAIGRVQLGLSVRASVFFCVLNLGFSRHRGWVLSCVPKASIPRGHAFLYITLANISLA